MLALVLIFNFIIESLITFDERYGVYFGGATYLLFKVKSNRSNSHSLLNIEYT